MIEAILFLVAALVFVPVAVRLGLGSVMGYLLAGLVIGPMGLAWVSDPAALLHISELGVVLMLFVNGLELEPKRLWSLRGAVFRGGTLQMLACAVALAGAGYSLGWRWQAALVGGSALALSSTAIAVAFMQERRWMPTPLGRAGFSILLYQDMAAIALLAMAALFGTAATTQAATPWRSIAQQLAALAAVVVLGRYVAYPAMRFVARMQVRELFTALALLLALGVAALMEHVGLSMGLGAFLAGVLLASSEYRHALEADILPFKGLLLGLFFIAVGMSMDLRLLALMPWQVVLGLALVVGLKLVLLWALAPWLGVKGRDKVLLAILLSQVGEFAFVVLAAAKLSGALSETQANLLTLIAAMSMMTTPILLMLFERYGARHQVPQRETDVLQDEHPAVILAGFGRYGQTVARLLLASGQRPTVIEHDADTVDSARRFGYKVYFGDPIQPDVLRAAGIAHAKAMVVALDDPLQCNRLVELLQGSFAHIRILARAHDALHAMELDALGVAYVEREMFESALRTGRTALELLGVDRFQAKQRADNFRRYSRQFIRHVSGDRNNEDNLIARSRQAREQFEREMQADQEREAQHTAPRGWHAP
jgi:glutathione-regulated potassium-efflux system ancillary protein KefC